MYDDASRSAPRKALRDEIKLFRVCIIAGLVFDGEGAVWTLLAGWWGGSAGVGSIANRNFFRLCLEWLWLLPFCGQWRFVANGRD